MISRMTVVLLRPVSFAIWTGVRPSWRRKSMRFLSSSVICLAMPSFLSLRLPSSPDRARGRREVVGAHDTEQPGFAKVNAPSFPREGYGVCHHSPSLCLTLLCLLLIAEVTTPNRVRLLPQSTPNIKSCSRVMTRKWYNYQHYNWSIVWIITKNRL